MVGVPCVATETENANIYLEILTSQVSRTLGASLSRAHSMHQSREIFSSDSFIDYTLGDSSGNFLAEAALVEESITTSVRFG